MTFSDKIFNKNLTNNVFSPISTNTQKAERMCPKIRHPELHFSISGLRAYITEGFKELALGHNEVPAVKLKQV